MMKTFLRINNLEDGSKYPCKSDILNCLHEQGVYFQGMGCVDPQVEDIGADRRLPIK
jgi:hypothetical protein